MNSPEEFLWNPWPARRRPSSCVEPGCRSGEVADIAGSSEPAQVTLLPPLLAWSAKTTRSPVRNRESIGKKKKKNDPVQFGEVLDFSRCSRKPVFTPSKCLQATQDYMTDRLFPRCKVNWSQDILYTQLFTGLKCCRVCTSNVRPYSHQHTCKRWPATLQNLRLRGISPHHHHYHTRFRDEITLQKI